MRRLLRREAVRAREGRDHIAGIFAEVKAQLERRCAIVHEH